METGRVVTTKVEEQRNPIDQVLEDADAELAREIKREKAETVLLTARQKNDRLRGGAGGPMMVDPDGLGRNVQYAPQAPVSTGGVLLASLIQGGMAPEKAHEFLQNLSPQEIAKLNMIGASGRPGGGNDMMLPLMLLGNLGSNSQVSVKDLVEIGPKYVESAAKLAEMNKPQSESRGEMAGMLTEMIKQLGEERKSNFNLQIQDLSRKIEESRTDPISTTVGVIKTLKEGGFVSDKSTTGNADIEIKIEELRTSREIEMLKMKQEMNRFMIEKNAESDRWDNILKTASPMIAIASKPIEEVARAAARKYAQGQPQTVTAQQITTPLQPAPQIHQPQPQQTVEVATLRCGQCGNEFRITAPFPQTVKCTKCGHTASFPVSEETPQTSAPQNLQPQVPVQPLGNAGVP